MAKFNRVAKIQKSYLEIDSKLRRFCDIDSLTERKACAFSVLMMIECGIRIGNDESAEGYISKAKKTEGQVLKTYGLTTLLRSHITFPEDGTMVLNFIGKKSVQHIITITDPLLIKIGKEFHRNSHDRWIILQNGEEIQDKTVNEFIKKSCGNGFTAKDFRAFRANIETARLINKAQQNVLQDSKKKTVNEEIKCIVTDVSNILGNSPSIARKAYINPQILRAHWNFRGFNVQVKTKKGKVKEIITMKTK
jgi:DNA topoisomerase IB